MTNNYITLDIKLSGQKIHAAIIESGYSVRDIQKMLSLACPNSIYRWINGYTLPSVENLYRLSLILNTTMENLIAFQQGSMIDKYKD
jgi:transcriptional regulator with XRE-family HTH domain